MSQKTEKENKTISLDGLSASDISDVHTAAKLLEMLLFYGMPQRDTAGLARELIMRFGSFSRVLDADVEELMRISGMTRNAASLIKLMRPLGRAYVLSKFGRPEILRNLDEIGNYVLTQYFAVESECFSLLCMNRLGRVISFEVLMSGNVDSVGVSVRTVMEKVLKSEATAVAIAHNHPGGIALPSAQDIEITRRLKTVLATVSVNLVDHIIVADDDYVSMAQTAEFSDIFSS